MRRYCTISNGLHLILADLMVFEKDYYNYCTELELCTKFQWYLMDNTLSNRCLETKISGQCIIFRLLRYGTSSIRSKHRIYHQRLFSSIRISEHRKDVLAPMNHCYHTSSKTLKKKKKRQARQLQFGICAIIFSSFSLIFISIF